MDVMLRDKAEELAKEIAVSISTQQELSDVMRLMTKSVAAYGFLVVPRSTKPVVI